MFPTLYVPVSRRGCVLAALAHASECWMRSYPDVHIRGESGGFDGIVSALQKLSESL